MSERCTWCEDNGMLQKYHDEEWGIPLHDDKKQFEFLMIGYAVWTELEYDAEKAPHFPPVF